MRRVLVATSMILVACTSSNEDGSRPSASSTSRDSDVTTATAAPGQARTLAELLAGSPLADAGCVDGAEGCIAVVIAEMERRLQPLVAACDHNAVFPLTYLTLTEAIGGAVESGAFSDPRWLRRLDAAFAQLYFDARDAWTGGRREDVSAPWREAFRTADARQLRGIGDLFISTNAHITHDLPISLGLVGVADGSHDADFTKVNEFISAAAPEVVERVAARLDATVASFSIPALDVDEATMGVLFSAWRLDSLIQGKRLDTAETEEAYAAALSQVVASAQARGLLIQTSTSYVPFSPELAEREAYCRAGAG